MNRDTGIEDGKGGFQKTEQSMIVDIGVDVQAGMMGIEAHLAFMDDIDKEDDKQREHYKEQLFKGANDIKRFILATKKLTEDEKVLESICRMEKVINKHLINLENNFIREAYFDGKDDLHRQNAFIVCSDKRSYYRNLTGKAEILHLSKVSKMKYKEVKDGR